MMDEMTRQMTEFDKIKKYGPYYINRTYKYILPYFKYLLDTDINAIQACYLDIDYPAYNGANDNGIKYIYLDVNEDKVSDVDYRLSNTSYFVEWIYHDNKIFLVLEVDSTLSSIIEKFIDGQYSKFPKDYIDSLVDTFILNTKTLKLEFNKAKSVCTKSPILKKKLEQRLGVELPDSAELDSKPYIWQEVYPVTKPQLNELDGNDTIMDIRSTEGAGQDTGTDGI